MANDSKQHGNGFPKGWEKATLGDVGEYLNGRAFKKFEWGHVGRPIIRIQDLTKSNNNPNYFKGKVEDRYVVRPGDLLVAWSATLGAFLWRGPEGVLNQHIFKVRSFIDRKFHYYLVQNILDELYRQAHGSGMVHITKGLFENTQVELPPLDEQERIVDKIEELLTDLDAGVAALERVRRNLARYRASVLKAAVAGRLTEQWRAEHPDAEPAEKLLERILIERRKHWETDYLAACKAKDRKPPKNWKAKYKPPAAPDTSNLPELPYGWCWTTLDQLGKLDRGISRHRPRNAPHLYSGPYPFIQTGDVRIADQYIREHKQTYSELGLAQSKLWPAGTLCITIAANIAETAILTYDACFPDSVVGVIFDSSTVSVAFIEFYIRTIREQIEHYAPATAQKNINNQILRNVAVALPPLEEQRQIVDLVEERISKITAAEQAATKGMGRAGRLRQSILKRAFEGKLVPQDPRDESAEKLLDRIRAERKK